MDVMLDMSELGLISGDEKRVLERYVDSSFFKQRKSYDEYYPEHRPVRMAADLRVLMILAEIFTVEIQSDSVRLKSFF